MDVELTLLGPPQVVLGGVPPPHLGTKPLALLAFLALESGPHARDELAALLWGDSAPAAARASLRQALHQLREAVGGALRITRRAVELDPEVRCDVRAFLDRIRRAPEEAAGFPVPRFLSGFEVPRAAAFEEWCESTRDRLLAGYRNALREATRHAMARSHWREAVCWSERWTAQEPLSDEATRFLVEALYMAGDRGEALARYEEHRRHLARETGAEVSASLSELARRIAGETGRGLPAPAATEDDDDLPAQRFEPSLVGRETPWQQLVGAWQSLRAGEGRVVLLEGEAGAGKTRLADEFLQWTTAEGATVLRGRGYDPGAGVPYAPVVEALRGALHAPGLPGTAPEWLAEVGRIVPEVAVRFANLPAPSAPGDTDRRWRLFESVAQLLMGLAVERPTMLFVDDLQRCDQESCALLHFLARRLAELPIVIMCSVTLGDEDRSAPAARFSRALRAGEGHAVIVTLGPLSEPEVWTIIRELGRVSSPEGARVFAREIHAATDGNPFHVLELLKALFAQGMLTADPGTGEWMASAEAGAGYQRLRLPRTIRDAVAERYGRLPYALRDLLATVATAGIGVSSRLLSHVHGISRLRAAALADALVDRRLLAGEDGLYRCAHPIILDVVRADLTPARQQELHRALAGALAAVEAEGEPLAGPGELARHAERGGERAHAYRYALRASEDAVRRRAHDEALTWLDVAARTASTDPEAAAVNARTAALLDAAGLEALPRQPRRLGETPARGIAWKDLDLPAERR